MLKINLICVGDIKEKYLKDAIEEYKKRLSPFCSLTIFECKETVAKSSGDILNALDKDAENILKHCNGHIISLAIEGKQYSSEEYAKLIEKISLVKSEIDFVIGASNGLSNKVKEKSNNLISFSKMTFPHQLMRVIFLEQTYRAFTILNNKSYHK